MRDLKRSFVLMLMQIFFFFKFVRLNHKTATSFTFNLPPQKNPGFLKWSSFKKRGFHLVALHVFCRLQYCQPLNHIKSAS